MMLDGYAFSSCSFFFALSTFLFCTTWLYADLAWRARLQWFVFCFLIPYWRYIFIDALALARYSFTIMIMLRHS